MESNFLKKDTNELTYKTEKDLHTSKTSRWLPACFKRKNLEGRDKSGACNEHTYTTIYKTDNQQGPTV